jgi:glycine cleavage system T protein (aminomethyltransferase)
MHRSRSFHADARIVNAIQQHLATRRAAGLFDFSFMSLIEIDGTGARAFLEYLQTRSIAALEPGRIVYTLLLHDDASVFIDATLWKHADDCWWLFAGRRTDIDTIQPRARSFDVRVRERSDEFAVLALQGPSSGRTLAKLAGEAIVRELRYFRFIETRLEGVRSSVGRLGYSGELGYEIVVPAAEATSLGSALLDLGVAECGFDAANSLRIESGYLLFDREVTGGENPLELGLERLVEVDGRDFIGKRTFAALRRAPQERLLVGLEIIDRVASPLLPVARPTSECESPIFRRRIALRFAPQTLSIGSLVRLPDGRLARTARLPFYDPSRRLPRGAPLLV